MKELVLCGGVSHSTKREQEKVLTPVVSSTPESSCANSQVTKLSARPEVKGKCQQCTAQGKDNCNHCFRCGKEGHRARLPSEKQPGKPCEVTGEGPPVTAASEESPVTVNSHPINERPAATQL